MKLFTKIDSEVEISKIRDAVKITDVANVISTFSKITKSFSDESQIKALHYAMVIEVGKSNELLGGHPIISVNDLNEALK